MFCAASSPFGILIRYPTGVGLFAFLRYASILAILSLSTSKISAHSWVVKVCKSSVCLLVNITVWYLELGQGLTEEKTVPPSVNRDLSCPFSSRTLSLAQDMHFFLA